MEVKGGIRRRKKRNQKGGRKKHMRLAIRFNGWQKARIKGKKNREKGNQILPTLKPSLLT